MNAASTCKSWILLGKHIEIEWRIFSSVIEKHIGRTNNKPSPQFTINSTWHLETNWSILLTAMCNCFSSSSLDSSASKAQMFYLIHKSIVSRDWRHTRFFRMQLLWRVFRLADERERAIDRKVKRALVALQKCFWRKAFYGKDASNSFYGKGKNSPSFWNIQILLEFFRACASCKYALIGITLELKVAFSIEGKLRII